MDALLSRLRTTQRVIADVLRSPGLRRLLLAFFAFRAVETGSWVAILLYAYEATGPATVGIVALAQLLPAAVIAPVAGTLGDRFPRLRVLALGYLTFGSLLALVGVGILAGWDPPFVYLLAIGAGTSLTVARPAHNALLPGLSTSTEELTAANASTSIAEAAGVLAGPLLVALILVVAGPGEALVVMAATMLVGAALVVSLRSLGRAVDTGPVASLGPTLHDGAGPFAGFAALAADRDARLIVGVLAAVTLMIGVTDVLFVLVALELFKTGESGAAILSAALGAGGILGGAMAFLLIGQPRIAPIIALCAAIWGVTFALMGLVNSGALAPLLLVVGGTGLAVLDVAGRTILQRAVPDEVLARVFGVLEGLNMAALALGSVLVSLVTGLIDLRAAVVVFAAFLPLAVGLAFPWLRAIDRRALVPTRALGLLRRLPLFEALDPPVLEGLARSATWVSPSAGDVLIREGDHGDRYYVLESGAVRITRDGQYLLDLDAPGDGFGEIALLRDVPRTATVTALSGSSLLVLERETFLGAVCHPAAHAEAHRIADERVPLALGESEHD
jgi:MFS family permease